MKRKSESLFTVLFALTCCCSPSYAGHVPKPHSVMYDEPKIEIPAETFRFEPGITPLWVMALERPEADLKKQAAFSIIWAYRREFDAKPFVAPLLANLSHRDLQVRLSSAKTLVAIEAREAADALFEARTGRGLEMAQLVEPALGDWKYEKMRDAWRSRLQKPDRATLTLLAIRGLGAWPDAESSDGLVKIATNSNQPVRLRLAAAESAGQVADQGLEPTAEKLAGNSGPRGVIDRLIAARLLQRHDSESARKLLAALALDEEPSVAVIALQRELELDADLIIPQAAKLLDDGDANVRSVVAKALAAKPTEATIRLLGDLLNDPIPKLRGMATQLLLDLAKREPLKPFVVAEGERMIESNQWRAEEQSVVLLTELKQPQVRMKFVKLLEHARPEVFVTAAWGLRVLGEDDTLEPILKIAQKRNKNRLVLWESPAGNGGIDFQLAQINQLFGVKRYAPAEAFLRTFVPKNFEVVEARAAAIWSLGFYHEGKPDEGLASQFAARLADVASPQSELELVRRFAALSLGRMKAESQLGALRKFQSSGSGEPVGYSCYLAVEWITGEPFERAENTPTTYTNFFIEPLPKR